MNSADRDDVLEDITLLREEMGATDEEAQKKLLGWMSAPDARVRAAAAEATWEYYFIPAILERAMRLVRQDADPLVQQAALVGIGRVMQEGQIDEIEETAIESIDSEMDLDPKIYWRVFHFLLDAASDESIPVGVRRFAVESLGFAGERSDVVALLHEWYGRPEPEAKRSAVFGMGNSRSDAFASQIVRHIDDPDREMRLVAIRAAGHAACEDAIDRVLAASRSKEVAVRRAAAEALGGYGGDDVLDRLEEMQDDADESVCDAADKAIESARDREL